MVAKNRLTNFPSQGNAIQNVVPWRSTQRKGLASCSWKNCTVIRLSRKNIHKLAEKTFKRRNIFLLFLSILSNVQVKIIIESLIRKRKFISHHLSSLEEFHLLFKLFTIHLKGIALHFDTWKDSFLCSMHFFTILVRVGQLWISALCRSKRRRSV